MAVLNFSLIKYFSFLNIPHQFPFMADSTNKSIFFLSWKWNFYICSHSPLMILCSEFQEELLGPPMSQVGVQSGESPCLVSQFQTQENNNSHWGWHSTGFQLLRLKAFSIPQGKQRLLCPSPSRLCTGCNVASMHPLCDICVFTQACGSSDSYRHDIPYCPWIRHLWGFCCVELTLRALLGHSWQKCHFAVKSVKLSPERSSS